MSACTHALLGVQAFLAKQAEKEIESDRIRSTDHQVLWVSLALNSPDHPIRAVINGKEKSYILLQHPCVLVFFTLGHIAFVQTQQNSFWT